MSFADLGLREEILRAIADLGYVDPTPVQAAAIPVVLTGRDVCAIAQTGTGKTASFTLPMIHRLSSGRARARMPRSLIISPTRELATQTADNFDKYGTYLNLSKALLIGGVALGEQEQILQRGVDVLIATPGRLLDQFERGNVLLTSVEILVIDEADRMLDMGFIPDVERIATLIAKKRQTLLFSATMPPAISKLAERFMNQPETIQVTRPATAAENVEDRLVAVADRQKSKALTRLIEQHSVDKAIIFCNRKRSVASLKRALVKAGFNAADIHGDLDQSARQATLDAFKRDETDLLVATDVAARGLDVSALPCVINYDVPTNPDDYVHRIGRTGRAGQKGRAFTFATPAEDKFVQGIEKLLGRPVLVLDGGELAEAPAPAAAPAAKEPATPPVAKEPAASPAAKAAAPEPETAPAPARKSRASAKAESGEPSSRGRRGGGRRRQDEMSDEPVIGFGDNTPSFLLREVPIKPAPGGSDDPVAKAA